MKIILDNWRLYVTAIFGAFIAFNSVLHIVPQNIQDALLAAAISLGFWAVHNTVTVQQEKTEKHVNVMMANQSRNMARMMVHTAPDNVISDDIKSITEGTKTPSQVREKYGLPPL